MSRVAFCQTLERNVSQLISFPQFSKLSLNLGIPKTSFNPILTPIIIVVGEIFRTLGLS
jgi:hypothetical protein